MGKSFYRMQSVILSCEIYVNCKCGRTSSENESFSVLIPLNESEDYEENYFLTTFIIMTLQQLRSFLSPLRFQIDGLLGGI